MQMQRHDHAEDAKNVTKIFQQAEVKISGYYAQYRAKFEKLLLRVHVKWPRWKN